MIDVRIALLFPKEIVKVRICTILKNRRFWLNSLRCLFKIFSEYLLRTTRFWSAALSFFGFGA
jgi:hypothetical protein